MTSFFLASIFFRSKIGGQGGGKDTDKDSVWEEVFLLVAAEDSDSASLKASDYASKKSGLTYPTESGVVTWEFVAVERVVEVDRELFATGGEIFSRYLRATEAKSMLTAFDD